MIEQIKTYKVTCDGTISEWYGSRELYSRCDRTCIVKATDKREALRQLPTGWCSKYTGSYNTILCPSQHREAWGNQS